MRAQLGLGPAPASSADQVPMTAALGGRFGSRSASLNAPLNVAHFANNDQESPALPPTPSSTTVISGGTSLGNLPSNNIHPSSKSDSAPSWRRTGSNSVLAGSRAVSSPLSRLPLLIMSVSLLLARTLCSMLGRVLNPYTLSILLSPNLFLL